MKAFTELGHDIERRWRRRHYHSRAFPEIAVDALRRAKIPSKVRPRDVLEWALGDHPMPQQFDLGSLFGEPPITMYDSAQFIIDVLFWNDGTTAIHEHGFSGAFQVLGGSSVHGVYSFTPTQEISGTFKIGTCQLQEMELLRRGDLRPILGGGDFIHSLFHLDRPSVSIVVRTKHDAELGTQLSYLPPSIAHAPFVRDYRTVRRVDALGALRQLGDDHYFASLEAHAADMELPTLFLALQRHYRETDAPRMKDVIRKARARHGRAFDLVLTALAEERRKTAIVKLRQRAHDPALRYFLAVMMNAPDRRTVGALLRARFGGSDPVALVVRHLKKLADLPALAGSGGENALQLPFGPHVPLIVELVLKDCTLPALMRRLERDYTDVREQRAEIDSLYRSLHTHPVLAAWWRTALAPGRAARRSTRRRSR
jgi:hypothetical protein